MAATQRKSTPAYLNEREREMLAMIADEDHVSASEAIRHMIRETYTHRQALKTIELPAPKRRTAEYAR